jgi:hypothetical protein
MADVPELSIDVIRELYSVQPEEFIYKRSELADRARKKGDGAVGTRIDKLRKPTVGAWIVNAFVLDDPSVVDTLCELGNRMRAAQDALDATELRRLSTERRRLVTKLTAGAFKRAKRADPPAGLRDEVTGTFDAAVADEDVANRLGRLQRPEQSYGFGFLPTDAPPRLTVVRGGRDDKPAAKKAPPAKPRVSAAEKRKRERALTAARGAFEKAEKAFDEANQSERGLADQVRQLTKRLAKLQSQLDQARTDLEQARKDTVTTRAQRRDARSALDRAERHATT